MDYIKRYGLLVLAVITCALQLFCPPARAYLRYASVVCMVLAPFHGRSFIRLNDVRGWMIQNFALLAHALVLIMNGMMGE